jgi:hypothetical protein
MKLRALFFLANIFQQGDVADFYHCFSFEISVSFCQSDVTSISRYLMLLCLSTVNFIFVGVAFKIFSVCSLEQQYHSQMM